MSAAFRALIGLACAFAMVGCTPPRPGYVFRASPLDASRAVALSGDEIMGYGRSAERWTEVANAIPLTEQFPCDGALTIDGIGDEITTYSRAADGSWRLDAVDAPRDDSHSVFAPPLTVAPAQLKPGESMRSEATMRVTSLKSGADKTIGPTKRVLSHAGAAIAELPDGPVIAQVVTVRFEANLTGAQAYHESEVYIVPGLGPIAERTSDLVRVFGLRLRETTHEFVRDQAGIAAAKP